MPEYLNVPIRNTQQRRAERYVQENPVDLGFSDYTEGLSVAFTQDNIIGGSVRAWERRSSQFDHDPEFDIEPEQLALLSNQYTKEELDYLQESNSKGEYIARQRFIAEDRAGRDKIAKLGVGTGVTFTLAASLLDPVALGVGYFTGGLSYGAKAAQVANSARKLSRLRAFSQGAGVAATESVLTEAYLRSSTSQKSEYDLYMAGAFGGLLGGVGGLMARKGANAEIDRAIALADAAKRESASKLEELNAKALEGVEIATPTRDTTAMHAWRDAEVEKLSSLDNPSLIDTLDGAARRRVKFAEQRSERLSNALDKINIKAGAEDGLIQTAEQLKKHNLSAKEVELVRLELSRRADGGGRQLYKDKTNPQLKKVISRFEKYQEAAKVAESAKQAKSLRNQITKLEAIKKKGLEENQSTRRKELLEEADRVSKLEGKDLEDYIKFSDPDYKFYTYDYQTAKRAKAILERPKVDAEQAELKQETSVGAAQVEGAEVQEALYEDPRDKIADLYDTYNQRGAETFEDTEAYVNVQKYLGSFASVGLRLVKSPSLALRGLSQDFFRMAQGGGRLDNADDIIENVHQKAYAEMGGALDTGFREWIGEQGLSKLKYISTATREKFDRKVIAAASNREVYENSSESVKIAVDGWRRMTDKLYKMSVDAGERGFVDGGQFDNYFTTIINDANFITNLQKHGRKPIKELLATSWEKGQHKIPKKQGLAIADWYIDKILARRNAHREVTTSTVSAEQVTSILQRNGVPDEAIDEIVNKMVEQAEDLSISNRAKASLGADLSTEINFGGQKLSMLDLIETDTNRITAGYIADRSAGIAWAKRGFENEYEIQELLTTIQKQSDDEFGAGTDEAASVREGVEIFRQALAAQKGRSLDPESGSKLNKTLRRTRQFTGIMLGQKLGLSAVPDLYRSLVNHGVGNFTRAVREAKIYADPNFAKSLSEGKKWGSAESKEAALIMGYSGFDDLLRGITRSVEIDETVGGSSAIDGLLQRGTRIGNILSGLRHVQRTIDQVSSRAAYFHLSKILRSGKASKKELRAFNLTAEDLARISPVVKASQKTINDGGITAKVMNYEALPNEIQDLVHGALNTAYRRNSQKLSVGEQPLLAHKELGRFFLQYKAFSLGSIEKQLIYDLKSSPALAAQMFTASMGFGYMVHALRTVAEAGSQDDPEEYWETNMNGSSLAYGVIANTGQLAATSYLGSGAAALNLLPDDLYASAGRGGYRPFSLGGLVPAVGLADTQIRRAGRVIESISEGEGLEAVDAALKTVPFLNSTALVPAMAAMGAAN